MIIDLILDRKGGKVYQAETFYRRVRDYSDFSGADEIMYAMDYLEEPDIRAALCDYIDNGGYNPGLKNFINSVSWLTSDGGAFECMEDIADGSGAVIFKRGRCYTADYIRPGSIEFRNGFTAYTFDTTPGAAFWDYFLGK